MVIPPRSHPAPHSEPVAVQYCATFLKPEMLHIYRQITGLRRWTPAVICQKREQEAAFPFPIHEGQRLVRIPKPATHALRRFWQKQICGHPVQIYHSEVRRLVGEIARLNGRVLHIYFGHIAVHLLPLLRRPPVPIVVSFHGADVLVDLEKPAYRRATEEMLRLATLVLVRSQSLAEGITRLGCLPEKIRLQRTGIPLDGFPFIERPFPADGQWRFLQACRLIPKKGIATTLRAFAAFCKVYPQSQLTLAGEGPLREELGALAGKLGVAENVTFPGFLSQEALRQELARSHAFLHPSEVGTDGNQEGVPNAMLEAMATGLPALATWHGGIPEAVDDGVSGYLVPERDHEALGAALLKLAASADTYAALSRAASAAAAERFDQARQIAVLEACYDEAVTLHLAQHPHGTGAIV